MPEPWDIFKYRGQLLHRKGLSVISSRAGRASQLSGSRIIPLQAPDVEHENAEFHLRPARFPYLDIIIHALPSSPPFRHEIFTISHCMLEICSFFMTVQGVGVRSQLRDSLSLRRDCTYTSEQC